MFFTAFPPASPHGNKYRLAIVKSGTDTPSAGTAADLPDEQHGSRAGAQPLGAHEVYLIHTNQARSETHEWNWQLAGCIVRGCYLVHQQNVEIHRYPDLIDRGADIQLRNNRQRSQGRRLAKGYLRSCRPKTGSVS